MLTQLKFQRLARNIKAIELAKKAKISVSLLSKIETGQIRPSKRARRKIAEAMGLSEKILFGE